MTGTGRILFICDNDKVSSEFREKLIVEWAYDVVFEPTAGGALSLLRQDSFDLVMLVFGMDGYDSIELVKSLRKADSDSVIIVIFEEASPVFLKEITRLGVYDSVVRPVNMDKLFFLIKKGIDLRSMALSNHKLNQSLQEQNTSLQKQNTLLAKRIEESTKNLTRLYEDLRTTYMRTIKVLAQAIDARDHYTHSHSENVAKYAVLIAEEMGLSVKDIELIREACELHDLGKIGIVDSILSKPSSLTPEEREQIERHPIIGAQILEPLTFLSDVIELVRQHHEHYDGKGYPEGKKGEDILLGARIINLADAYEAMTSPRAYRNIPLSKAEAVAEIRKYSGVQFDPKVVAAFLKILDRL